RRQRIGPLVAGEAQSLRATDSEAPQEKDEVVCVLHLRPGGAQGAAVDLRVGPLHRRGRGHDEALPRRLIGGSEVQHQAIELLRAAGVREEDLQHSGAGGVEDLQAAPETDLAVVVDGKSNVPTLEEETQIDLLAEDEARVSLELDVLEAALLLDDGV